MISTRLFTLAAAGALLLAGSWASAQAPDRVSNPQTPMMQIMIPQGRGQFIITQVPAPAEPAYALTGEPQRYQANHAVVVRLGIRGNTVVEPGYFGR